MRVISQDKLTPEIIIATWGGGIVFDLLVAILLEWIHIFVPPGTRNFMYWASWLLLWAIAIFYTTTFIGLNCVFIWKLQMKSRTKVGVSVIFAIGFLACVAAGARIVLTLGRQTSPDYTFTFSAVILSGTAELTGGILVMLDENGQIPLVRSEPVVLSQKRQHASLGNTRSGILRTTRFESTDTFDDGDDNR
ncbi:hypothetical protein CHU98_g6784 [Xylaria longipes]|nr:hypothetical protein CHU98_g6784 [Xylaria longipes]